MVEIRNSGDKIVTEELYIEGRLVLKWILEIRCEMWTGPKGSENNELSDTMKVGNQLTNYQLLKKLRVKIS